MVLAQASDGGQLTGLLRVRYQRQRQCDAAAQKCHEVTSSHDRPKDQNTLNVPGQLPEDVGAG
jgi:hypothetical protein